MAIDTTQTIRISASPLKLIGLAAIGVVFVGFGLAFVLGYMTTRSDILTDIFVRAVGVISIGFFGFCLVIVLARLFGGLGSVITVSPEGVRDVRVAAEVVPWRAITDISTWQMERTRIIVLAIDPAAERALTPTRIARWTRGMNASLGADGLSIATTDLKIDHDTLLAIVTAYWQAYRGLQAT